MNRISELLQYFQETLPSDHLLAQVIELQLTLARALEAKISRDQAVFDQAPIWIYGSHPLIEDPQPVSTTGRIFLTEDGLAIKALAPDDALYKFDSPEVAMMCVAGELLAGRTVNADSTMPLYYGVAALAKVADQQIELQPLHLSEVLDQTIQPVLVMRRMDGDLYHLIQDIKQGQVNGDLGKISDLVIDLCRRVIELAVPLDAETARRMGTMAGMSVTLTAETPGWLVNRAEAADNPGVAEAVKIALQVIKHFEQFLGLPETEEQLAHRAFGMIETNGQAKVAMSYALGDFKLLNILYAQTENGLQVGAFDPNWLITREGVNGLELPTFAPWAFADIILTLAYQAMQAYALDVPPLYEAIKGLAQEQVGEEWSDWHELYWMVLVAYKLLVQAAVNVTEYVKHCDPATHLPLPSMPLDVKEQVEAYPELALQLVQAAFATYRARELS